MPITLRLLVVPVLALLAACSSSGPGVAPAENPESWSASDRSISASQNANTSIELAADGAAGVMIVNQPRKGVVSVSGTLATYRTTDPLFTGSDSFTYKLTNGASESDLAQVNVLVNPSVPGSHSFVENYQAGAFALSGWTPSSSSFGHTASSTVQFSNIDFNGAPSSSRRFGIFGDIASYGGDSKYQQFFGKLPVDGSNPATPMWDWPWKADLIRVPECNFNSTIEVKINSNGTYVMAAVLLNYDIRTNSSGQTELTGYQVLANGGGGSMTLSRFDRANEYALSFMDRWPNSGFDVEASNPITSGPYKGWNYKNSFPAGGNLGTTGSSILAVHYKYEPSTKITTISYEARRADGTDDTPGSYDVVVNLTGADSLNPGGNFGILGTNYHTGGISPYLQITDFHVAEYKMACVVP